jgi:hypothetical protein
MRDLGQRFFWISAYAIAMALLEAVVVAYLRALLLITDEHVALGSYIPLEIGREVATIVMLVAVGWLGVGDLTGWLMVYLPSACGTSGTISGSRC